MVARDAGAKAIVFSQFTSMLDLCAHRLGQVRRAGAGWLAGLVAWGSGGGGAGWGGVVGGCVLGLCAHRLGQVRRAGRAGGRGGD